MTAEEFIAVHNDTELRDYILRRAKRVSQKVEEREDMVQEAWLWISAAPGDYTTEKYKQIARRAIAAVHHCEFKQYMLLCPRVITEAEVKRAGGFQYVRVSCGDIGQAM